MTVLEKIKRCVSLVWDFQEIYDEEDIEDFCRNELHTYPQYNEILDYFKRIAELEEENAELKSDFIKSCKVKEQGFREAEQALERKDNQLTEAKDLLKKCVCIINRLTPTTALLDKNERSLLKQAEQFLKDCEVEK